jgi:hypothetical protein
MKVAELMEALKQLPPDLAVFVWDGEDGTRLEVTGVDALDECVDLNLGESK